MYRVAFCFNLCFHRLSREGSWKSFEWNCISLRHKYVLPGRSTAFKGFRECGKVRTERFLGLHALHSIARLEHSMLSAFDDFSWNFDKTGQRPSSPLTRSLQTKTQHKGPPPNLPKPLKSIKINRGAHLNWNLCKHSGHALCYVTARQTNRFFLSFDCFLLNNLNVFPYKGVSFVILALLGFCRFEGM